MDGFSASGDVSIMELFPNEKQMTAKEKTILVGRSQKIQDNSTVFSDF